MSFAFDRKRKGTRRLVAVMGACLWIMSGCFIFDDLEALANSVHGRMHINRSEHAKEKVSLPFVGSACWVENWGT